MKKALLVFLIICSRILYAQSDCISAISICGNSDISYTPSGPGNILEGIGANSCLSDTENEHFSVWYSFTAATSGTLAFVINPTIDTDDYDFAVYGPTTNGCTSLNNSNVFVTPVRCNFNGTGSSQGNTGLLLTIPPPPPPNTNGSAGNQSEWSPHMVVQAGETYYLVVDNYRSSPDGFSLTWTGTASLSSAFNDPALAPFPFITPGLPAANPADPNEVTVCSLATPFNFLSLNAGVINGNSANFKVTYHKNTNDAITGGNPVTSEIVNLATVYYYRIVYQDPANPTNPMNGCFITGKFKFRDGSFALTNATLTSCSNNNAGTAMFDLTTATIGALPSHVLKYYPTMFDLNAGTNEITSPSIYQFVSAEGKIFVKATNEFGCTATAEITLKFHPLVTVTDASLRTCFLETNHSLGTFNLSNATVTTQLGATKKYYPSQTDAVNGTNEILNFLTYTAPSGVIYVKVINAQGCYNIAKVTLTVLSPVYSNVLQDKIICIEDKTTLDAGPGFNAYEWSTGATTQVINSVAVGTYWVKLKTGDCITLQTVKVYASEQPVVSSIDISNTTITVNVIAGAPEYKYSMDNVNWQDSNVFTNVSRGDHKIYVKDAYDCDPIEITVVVPNLINVITPNGDGVNDFIDYSALSGKNGLIFSIFDRYGTKIHQADKSNGYKWDGTVAGKKIPTGTYWYSVTWNENDKKNTPFKFSGWVMVKNRE
ncbi:gliding motility-associated C-terminal domain-containing protein [Chryseobacterium carnipullorum]|uniref:Gliding motility-associated C-terminal domain n=1 Tax=Chryseobacterium carnipullorum TaxID=1124835 RepID=A0A1M7CFT0_CHRCU|nr:T9SS type B sorting domain-containing protein [Chryseobacterium carnipullorum]AZA47531.1 gliding motility-associated C-terminal domain-containing protein [Chryseobacterium carnipullorum]AZA66864.1 gliding motility-associated C-terminal domain-containing protein [Chryseobacterium carnipullorum]SHL66074.1 gliding motility-associated C-terminal domain-containing protein [Chryseobacterium carnipullorum]STD10421.1 gliding motility-associated C-terminal domain [Chryseobacterium carnipullorum]